MKNSYEVRAKKFVESFDAYLTDRKNICRVREAVSHFNEDFYRKVKICYGAVRIALLTSDYVIKWDYDSVNASFVGGCRAESSFYNKKIKKSGYEYLFAKITRYRYNGKTFYIMPRIDKLAKEKEADYIEDFLNQEEIDFIDEIGLGDLHNENWGFIKGQPIIIDYACFE